jgi:flagellar basal-body rod modification protein FlgD
MSTISAVTSSTTSATKSTSATEDAEEDDDAILSQDDFLLLLVTELTNQDPLEPMSNQEMVSQITEMQMLDETISQTDLLETMSENMSSLSAYMSYMTYDSRFQAGSSLVGLYVYGTDSDGNDIEGMVTNASMSDGEVTLTLHTGDTIPYENVTDVTEAVVDTSSDED